MQLKPLFCSSVGQKFLLALTGFGLSGFVLIHMTGNMLILVSPEAYNTYSHKLITNPLLLPMEVGLFLLFLAHISLALRVTFQNRKARPIAPDQHPSNCDKNARFGSRWMALTGLLVLAFLILHLKTFKYGTYYSVTYSGVEMRDLYRLVIELFQIPWYTGIYIFAMLVLLVHLSHGASAMFQSLGIVGVRHCKVKLAGWAFALLIAGGFLSQPIYAILTGGAR